MRLNKYLLLLLSGILLLGCSATDEGGILETPRRLLDKATPTESARARRAGFMDKEKVFFITELDGKRRSSGYRVRKSDTVYNEQPARLLETHQRFDMVSKQGYRISQLVTRKTIVAVADGSALYESERSELNGQTTQRTISVYDGVARFTESGPDGESEDVIEVPPGVMFAIDSVWLAQQNPDIGDTFTRKIIDRDTKTIVDETVTIRDITDREILGVNMLVYEADVVKGDFSPTRIVFNKNGDLLRQQADNLISFVVTEDVASRDEAKIVASSSIPMNFQLPAWDNFNLITLDPQPQESWAQYLKESDYVTLNGDRIVLKKFAPLVSNTTYPLVGADKFSDYLVENEDIVVDDWTISGMAEDIVGAKNDALEMIAMLAGWVYQNIEYDPGQGSNINALETLKKRRGDYNAHANLFASLARSLGFPTRACAGLLIQRDEGIYHIWTEVWINGTWVPVDTTVNRVGLPAGYILTSRGDGSGITSDQFAWAVRDDALSINFISATKYHKNPTGDGEKVEFTLFPNEKKSYVAISGDWLANIYWGFSFYKPYGWNGNIALKTVSVTSPNKEAVFKIDALNKVLPCTESQLDMIIVSLERSLSGFNLINKGRVYFGKRNDNSLFVDFAVTQDGLRRRCKMYVIPKRGRSYRVTAWAPYDDYAKWNEDFDKIIAEVEL